MALQDNNIAQTQSQNAAYLQANPNAFGGSTAPTQTPTTQTTTAIQQPAPQPTSQPVQQPVQQAPSMSSSQPVQSTPQTPPALPQTTIPQSPQGLAMPTGTASQAMYNPLTGTQQVNGQTVNFSNLQQAFQSASGTPPQTAGGAQSAIQGFLGSSANSTANSNALNFLNTNPTIQSAIQQVQQYLQPTMTAQTLQTYVDKVQTDQTIASGLNTQLMNLNTVMNGTSNDIRSEVTAANGFATESQITALATARNKTLLQQATMLQNQLNTATDAVKNDQNLLSEERSIATDQFNQNATILSAAQKIQDQITSAQKDGLNTVIGAVGLTGLVNGLMNADPSGQQLANAAQILGMTPAQLQSTASQSVYNTNLKAMQTAGVSRPYGVTPAGEVQDAKTGYAYTSQADFQAKTGMTVQQANAKGLFQTYNPNVMNALDLQAKQASINASNASAASSGVSAAKNAYELSYEKANGGLTPAEVQAQNIAVSTAQQAITGDAADLISKMTAKTNPISWQSAFSQLKTKYYPTDNSQEAINTIDNLLQANNYRR